MRQLVGAVELDPQDERATHHPTHRAGAARRANSSSSRSSATPPTAGPRRRCSAPDPASTAWFPKKAAARAEPRSLRRRGPHRPKRGYRRPPLRPLVRPPGRRDTALPRRTAAPPAAETRCVNGDSGPRRNPPRRVTRPKRARRPGRHPCRGRPVRRERRRSGRHERVPRSSA